MDLENDNDSKTYTMNNETLTFATFTHPIVSNQLILGTGNNTITVNAPTPVALRTYTNPDVLKNQPERKWPPGMETWINCLQTQTIEIYEIMKQMSPNAPNHVAIYKELVDDCVLNFLKSQYQFVFFKNYHESKTLIYCPFRKTLNHTHDQIRKEIRHFIEFKISNMVLRFCGLAPNFMIEIVPNIVSDCAEFFPKLIEVNGWKSQLRCVREYYFNKHFILYSNDFDFTLFPFDISIPSNWLPTILQYIQMFLIPDLANLCMQYVSCY